VEVDVDPRVRRTIAIMEEQLHARLTVADVAARIGLSVSHLTRLFRDDTGLTPGAFLLELRMSRARILVERTSLPVNAVMAHVGISDRSHFARDFRRAYGLSPRTLRIQPRVLNHRPG
jgi:AraC family transcriptional regulator